MSSSFTTLFKTRLQPSSFFESRHTKEKNGHLIPGTSYWCTKYHFNSNIGTILRAFVFNQPDRWINCWICSDSSIYFVKNRTIFQFCSRWIWGNIIGFILVYWWLSKPAFWSRLVHTENQFLTWIWGYIDVGNKICWWLLWDFGDRFYTIQFTNITYYYGESRKHIDLVTNIWTLSPTWL